MKYDDLRKALREFQADPEALSALANQIDALKRSQAFTFLTALRDHMIQQQLRAGGESLVDMGRLQGMNSLVDFIDFIAVERERLEERIKREREENKKFKETNIPQAMTPGGYGIV
jgi:hypothetical protein